MKTPAGETAPRWQAISDNVHPKDRKPENDMTHKHALSTLFATMLFCGCETVKQARVAQSENDRQPGERTVTAERMGLTKDRPQTLTNLEQTARLYHPTVFKARQSVESAKLQVHIIRAGRLPSAGASGTYNRSTQNSWGYSTKTGMKGSWSGSLSLDFLLFDFGKLDAKEKQAIENLISSQRQLRQTEMDVTYDVQTAFFELQRAAELYRVDLESERQYAEHLDEAKTMAEVGTRRPYDVTKAQVDLGNARLEVITASNTLFTARAQLDRNLGLTERTCFEIRYSLMPTNSQTIAELMSIAETNTPSLAVLAAKTRAASFAVDEAVAELYPDLSLGADASVSGRGFPLAWNYSWAAKIVQDLFTGYRKTDTIKQAVADLRSARADQADAEQALYLQIVQAVAQRESSLKSLEVSEMIVHQSKENLDIINEQYRVGLASSIERTDAQVSLTKAQGDMVRARYDYQLALAHIAYLTGQISSLPPEP